MSVELPPSVLNYYSRIGADILNYRRAAVRAIIKGYPKDICLITLKEDGTVKVSSSDKKPVGKQYHPTDIEAKQIAEDLTSGQYNFPKSVLASEAELDKLRNKLKGDFKLYVFYALGSSDIIMVQERVDPAFATHGQKYRPWVMLSNGEWQAMEPTKLLPFWKPKNTDAAGKRIMLHEGAKAAAAAQDIVDNQPDHPWHKELALYEHWGMIGGAFAAWRVDYSELNEPYEVVYACDHDRVGEGALCEVSKFYGKRLKGLIFGNHFPLGWDLADKMPPSLFTKANRYIGPGLRQLLVPATWATFQEDNPSGKGRKVTKITDEFAEEWRHCVKPEVYLHRDWPNQFYSAGEFDNKIRPFSHVNNTSTLLKADDESKVEILKYDPALDTGKHTSSDGRFINTYRGSDIEGEDGDDTPWIDFLDYFIVDDNDRYELKRWCATLIARPDIRMTYGVLLISEVQGVGKGTLGEKILAPLVGMDNVSFPSESEIVESNYNYWLAHKRLAVVHEIYAGNSSKAYNKLKSYITDKNVTVQKKYQPDYNIDCWLHVLAMSNSQRALKLAVDDRRWFIPKVTEIKRPVAYWETFNKWLREEGGLQIIRNWAERFVETHENVVVTGANSPDSQAKSDMIIEAYSEGQNLVHQCLIQIDELIASGKLPANSFVVDTDLVNLIRNQVHEGRHSDKLEKPLTVRAVGKALGWKSGVVQAQISGWSASTRGGRVMSRDESVIAKTPGELNAEGLKPVDLSKIIGF